MQIIKKEYHICRTGKLEQHYTLYITHTVIYGDKFFNASCCFRQNLGYNKNDALSKVEKMIGADARSTIDFCDSTKKEYCDLRAFGLEWKKTQAGFITNLDKHVNHNNDPEVSEKNKTIDNVWQIWREKKADMKEQGFSIFKNGGLFALFFKNCTDGDLYTKMKILDTKFEAQGEYIGEIGTRVKEIPVRVEKIQSFSNDYTASGQKIWFVTESGNIVISKYTGVKYKVKQNENYKLTGTIKIHQIMDKINTTIINRIILK